MKTLALASCSGGTGKSGLAAVLGKLLGETLLMDLSTGAAGLRTYVGGTPFRVMEHASGLRAEIDLDQCSGCGRCIEVCPLGAISSDFVVDPCLCDGCGLCLEVCQPEAIVLTPNQAGRYYYVDTDIGLLLDTDMVGADSFDPGFLPRVFAEGKKLAEDRSVSLLVVDMLAGIDEVTLPVLKECDLVLVVTEPTSAEVKALPQGLKRLKQEGISALLCLNRFDLNRDRAMEILDVGLQAGVRNAGRIGFHTDLFLAPELAHRDGVSFAGLIPLEMRKDYVKLMHTVNFFLKESGV